MMNCASFGAITLCTSGSASYLATSAGSRDTQADFSPFDALSHGMKRSPKASSSFWPRLGATSSAGDDST